MIIDAHTHVFPPEVIARRATLAGSEPVFAEIYANPKAAMATAEDLLASMDAAGVDKSVVCNVAWQSPALIDETNAYILDAAARSGGRLVPFVSAVLAGVRHGTEPEESVAPAVDDPRRRLRSLAAAGARGIGELRPASSGWDLANSDEGDLLAWAAQAFDLALLFHVTEPAGHAYAGKQGLAPGTLATFAAAVPAATIIAAHWGGGLPFYTLMPEVSAALGNTYFDTAASHLLYDAKVYRVAIELVGVARILFASDFPLTSQSAALERTRAAGMSDAELAAVLGGNAARVLGI